jgi:hypothetical protein
MAKHRNNFLSCDGEQTCVYTSNRHPSVFEVFEDIVCCVPHRLITFVYKSQACFYEDLMYLSQVSYNAVSPCNPKSMLTLVHV